MRQYSTFTLSFNGPAPAENEAQADVTAVFRKDGKETAVKGFYAGNNTYKVRFYPSECGTYTYEVAGAVNGSGSEICEPAEEGRHGMVRANGLHFRYEDGTRYAAFGTTIYALVHQDKELIDTTMETLSEASFNKVRFCVFPKHYDYNHNEPEYFAFEKTDGKFDVTRPCYPFWDALESRIEELDRMGIQGDLILFHPYDRWGFSRLTKEECLIYLDYLTRRLAAFPNLWWSLANEYDLLQNFKEDWWETFAAFLGEHDPYGHLLSNHNCLAYWDFHNKNTTHCCLQDVCVQDVPDLMEEYGKPVIFDECRYEGNIIHAWGNLSGFDMANRFWMAETQGAYCTHGETFMSPDEILWWARGGVLHGESPARIAFLRKIIEALPGDLDPYEVRGTRHELADLKKKAEKDPSILEGLNPFVRGMLKMPVWTQTDFLRKTTFPKGHCGDQAFLYYLGRQCASVEKMTLPETGSYTVEVIDMWEMTRKTVMTDAKGEITVELPGKEGMAILALKNEETA